MLGFLASGERQYDESNKYLNGGFEDQSHLRRSRFSIWA